MIVSYTMTRYVSEAVMLSTFSAICVTVIQFVVLSVTKARVGCSFLYFLEVLSVLCCRHYFVTYDAVDICEHIQKQDLFDACMLAVHLAASSRTYLDKLCTCSALWHESSCGRFTYH
jgi:hypothetical protein